MIIVGLTHLRQQVVLTPNMRDAARFFERPDLAGLPDGVIELDGRRVYASVQSCETSDDPIEESEGHQRYIDVQFVAAGEEIVSCVSAANAKESTPYDAESDYLGATAPAEVISDVRLDAGERAHRRA